LDEWKGRLVYPPGITQENGEKITQENKENMENSLLLSEKKNGLLAFSPSPV
jgi:hypothetical protein